ncbi:MAG: MobQ family relaxase [Clostridia bacterium]
MAIFHCSIKIVSRGKGKSAVGASAYRSGTKMLNEYDGITHDYTKKGGIFSSTILLPENAPNKFLDRNILWNEVEKIEKSKNSQLAREIEVSIPKEIPSELWQGLMNKYCQQNFVDKGMIADFSIHNNDENNPHCHILLTMRPLNLDGTFGAKSKKEYVLDENGQKIKLPSGSYKSVKISTVDWNEQSKAELWRGNWSNICNKYLQELGVDEKIDHRSYERQGVDKIPSIHLGVSASQMENKGIKTQRGELNRQILQDNKELRILNARMTRLNIYKNEVMRKPLDTALKREKPSVVAMLNSVSKTPANTNYQKKMRTKNFAKAISFVNKYGIEEIDDFYKSINDMNRSFHTLKSEIIAEEKIKAQAVDNLDSYNLYKKLQPIYKKYTKLNVLAQLPFKQKYSKEIEKYKQLDVYFKDYYSKNGKISRKTFEKAVDNCDRNVKSLNWRMVLFKDEIAIAEIVKRQFEEMCKGEEVVLSKDRNNER